MLQVGSKEGKRTKLFGYAETVVGIYAIGQVGNRICQVQEAFPLNEQIRRAALALDIAQ